MNSLKSLKANVCKILQSTTTLIETFAQATVAHCKFGPGDTIPTVKEVDTVEQSFMEKIIYYIFQYLKSMKPLKAMWVARFSKLVVFHLEDFFYYF